MRIAILHVRLKTDFLHGLADDPAPPIVVAADTVHQQPLLDDLTNRKPRAKGPERILEDDLHLASERP